MNRRSFLQCLASALPVALLAPPLVEQLLAPVPAAKAPPWFYGGYFSAGRHILARVAGDETGAAVLMRAGFLHKGPSPAMFWLKADGGTSLWATARPPEPVGPLTPTGVWGCDGEIVVPAGHELFLMVDLSSPGWAGGFLHCDRVRLP